MDRRRIAIGFLGYVFIGTAVVLIPSLMPSISGEFQRRGWSLATIGLLVPAGAAGSIGGTVLAGIGSDLFGHRRLILCAALALAVALALTATATPWLLFVLGFVAASTAQSALSTGINAMIASAGRSARARALNMLHGVYGLGAAASPLVIGFALDRGLPWRAALGATGGIWLVYGLLAWTFVGAAQADDAPIAARKLDVGMLREMPFLALFLVAFVYNGVAVSLLSWVALFTQQAVGLPAYLSISMVSVFYVALTLGRFICAFVAERLGYASTLLMLGIGAAIAYPLVVFGTSAVLVVVGVFFTGLSLSGLFPTALADGARRYPERTGTVTGTLQIALTLGSLVPPVWTGILADAYSLKTALGVNAGMIVVLLVAARYLGTHRVQEVKEAQGSGGVMERGRA